MSEVPKATPRTSSSDNAIALSPLVYILPVHNEEKLLEGNVARLAEYLGRLPGTSIYLVENGSTDASWPLAERLARTALTDAAEYAWPRRAERFEALLKDVLTAA